jgi:hypothetical protein
MGLEKLDLPQHMRGSDLWGLLVVECFVGFKVGLYNVNELFEQVFVLYGLEGFQFFAVFFGLYYLHDVEVDSFFVFGRAAFTMLAFTVAVAFVGIAQDNVLFAVVEEIAYHFQQNIVAVFIDTFDEISGFFFDGGLGVELFVTVQWKRLFPV